MTLKNRNETPGNGGFMFQFEGPNKEVITVKHGSNSISQLTGKATVIMRRAGIAIPPNLAEIVEHQICLRQARPMEECFSGGVGDTIHQKWIKPFLGKVAASTAKLGRIGRAITKVVNAIGSCGGCGGRKVHQQGKNSLGRAGVLNKLSK